MNIDNGPVGLCFAGRVGRCGSGHTRDPKKFSRAVAKPLLRFPGLWNLEFTHAGTAIPPAGGATASQLAKCQIRVIGWTGLCIHISGGARQIKPISVLAFIFLNLLRVIGWTGLCCAFTSHISVLACISKQKQKTSHRVDRPMHSHLGRRSANNTHFSAGFHFLSFTYHISVMFISQCFNNF